MTTNAQPATALNGGAPPAAFPFDRAPDSNGHGHGHAAEAFLSHSGPAINGVQWPPTPAEPPSTPEPTPPRPRMATTPGGRRGGPQSRARTMPAAVDDLDDDAALNAHERRHDGGTRPRAHAKIRSYEDRAAADNYPRISRPVELLRPSYDVVVIGSGYGGGVAAARMARAGRSVCLLELGRERWPGEYPAHAREAFAELHCSGDLAAGCLPSVKIDSGRPTGMYHLIMGKGQNVVVCNGASFLS